MNTTSSAVDRLITCVSNTDTNPANTLAKFTHKLAFPINLPNHEEWCLALHTLGCHNQIEGLDSGLIKIKCEEVDSSLGTGKVISIHARRPYRPGFNKTHVFKPKHYKFFSLATNVLDRLSFTLLNEDNLPIKFSIGQPTFIVIILRRIMADHTQSLYISSRPTVEYPGNKANKFSTNFPLELSQYSKCPFEISAADITFTPRFKQLKSILVPTELDDRIIFRVNNFSLEQNIVGKGQHESKTSHIRYDSTEEFLCVEDLLKSMNNILDRAEIESEHFTEGLIHLKFFPNRMSSSGRNVVGLALPNLPYDLKLEILLPRRLAFQLGFRDVEFEGNHAIIEVRSGEVSEAHFPPDHDFWLPETLMLYTNFTTPTMVGSSFSRVLKIFPIRLDQNQDMSHVTVQDPHLDFHGIEQSSLNGLNFELRGLDGSLIEFQEKYRPEVLLTLLIREIKKE